MDATSQESNSVFPRSSLVTIPASDEVSGLRFEERVLIADFDELAIAGAAFISNASQMGIPFLAVFSDNLRYKHKIKTAFS